MKIAGPLYEARFLARPNRFLARVKLNGKTVEAHVRDPGRLKELLVKGCTVYLARAAKEGRKTGYDLLLVRWEHILISIDSTLPNRLIHQELKRGAIEPFRQYKDIRPKIRHGKSRFDFLLQSDSGSCYVEIKSTTLTVRGRAMFPDAVTSRGTRHVRELLELRREGHAAAIIFVVQREDVHQFTTQDEIDPLFGLALREAAQGGVKVQAYKCRVDTDEVSLAGPIDVKL